MVDKEQIILDALNKAGRNIMDYESIYRDACDSEMLKDEAYFTAVKSTEKEPETTDWNDFFREIEAIVSNGFLWESELNDHPVPKKLLESLQMPPNKVQAQNDFAFDVPLRICSIDNDVYMEADIPDDFFPGELNLKSVLTQLPERLNTGHMKASFKDGTFRLEMPMKEAIKLSRIK